MPRVEELAGRLRPPALSHLTRMPRSDTAAGPAGADVPSAQPPSPSKPHHADHRQRLRERFLSGDAERFSDYELLELLLFFSIERVDVKPLAKALLAEFGSLGAYWRPNRPACAASSGSTTGRARCSRRCARREGGCRETTWPDGR